MKKIAIYGKGGSGKSTISAALSVTFARAGKKVLHVGCDPKADSTFTLTGGRRIRTLLDLLGQGRLRPEPAEFVVRGRLGIDCVEAGGPKPGAGCGGRGIARMFELFDEIKLLERGGYDIVVFDVLGDVVCGGFAAPLRLGFADRAFIVVSEEPLSMYAANNIVHAVDAYSANGVRLGGLILNVSDDLDATAMVGSLATAIGTKLAGVIPRDRAIQTIEREHLTAAELPESSPTVAAVNALAGAVEASFDEDLASPRPLSVEELFAILSPGREPPATVASEPVLDADCCGVDEPPQAEPEPPQEKTARGRALPADRTVVGGPASRAGIGRLLGLEQGAVARLLLEVTDVTFARNRLLATVAGPSLTPLTFEFKHLQEGEGYGIVNDVSLSHTTSLNKTGRTLMDRLVERAQRADLHFDHLTTMLARDPDAAIEASQEQRKDAARQKVGFGARHWSVWGEEGTRGVFIFDQERSRQILGELRLGDGALRVHHGTEACQASEEDTDVHTSHFVRFPWRLEGMRKDRAEGTGQFLTNIRDYELIAGSNNALALALDEVQRTGDGAPVVIDISCTPVIAGEDWQGTIARFSQAYDGLVVASAVGGTDLTRALLAAGRQALSAADFDREGTGIHWVGFPRTASTKELAELLGTAGMDVRQQQIPVLSLNGLRNYGDASAQLLWPQREYQALTDELFGKVPLASEVAQAPFGIDGVETFVLQASRLAGLDPDEALGRLSAELDEARASLEPLRRAARGARVGVALTARQAHLLQDPADMCGVPLVDFLEQLGFQVEVLHDSQDEDRLSWWLRSGLSLVYSDLSYDRRLQAAGLPYFGLADLEPGLAGAVRTARRLLRLSRARFFANYGRFATVE